MKQLGALMLPDSLQWVDRFTWAPVQQSAAHTLAGRLVYSVAPVTAGQPITLLADENSTWLELNTVQDLLTMAAQAGATFPLQWEEAVYLVLFRHHDPPALNLRPLWPHHDHYIGTIKLIVAE
jgi:hypothetical protein